MSKMSVKKWCLRKARPSSSKKKTRQEEGKGKKFTGSGVPRGGPHSIIATSPSATRVFCGSNRKSSRSTTHTKKRDEK